MGANRLDVLKAMVAQNPSDSFSRYGLAMEYRNAGDLERAMVEFRALLAANADYVPAYFHGGQTLERLGELDQARELYESGIEAAMRTGDQHARGELQTALELLG
jgi:tetratricopeptide (TPR) repeat protein